MSYMDLLSGHTRTNAPTIVRRTVTDRRSAVNAARDIERNHAEREHYKRLAEMRGTMMQRTGMCG